MILSIEGENKLYRNLEDVGDLVKQVKKEKKRILSINLTGNVFNPEPMEALFKEIAQLRKLREAVLVGVFATLQNETMLECLSIVSRYLPVESLEVLDMSDNALSCNLPGAFRGFVERLSNLRILKLNNCGLGEGGGNWLADSLGRISNKDNLEAVEIAQNKFMNFPEKLGAALKEFPYLDEIRIQYNTINHETMDSFLKLFENHSLRVLDIRDNFLSLEGCATLGRFFANCEVEEMALGDCMMGTDGLKAFLKHASQKKIAPKLHGSFRPNRKKFILDVSFNDITQEGIVELVRFFRKYDVEVLSIQGNEYEDCSELLNVLAEKGGRLVHDYEESGSKIVETEGSLIKRFEEIL